MKPLLPLLSLLVLFCVACSGADSGDVSADPTPRVTKGGLDGPPVAVAPFLDGVLPPRTPNGPASSTWTIEEAFPALNLANTLVITANPSDDRLYVGSRDGLIVSFDNQPDVSTTETFLDLRDRVAVVWDGGFLGLVFHPEFGDAGSPHGKSFYVFYSSHCPLDTSRNAPDLAACDTDFPMESTSGFFNTYLRLSRFEVFDGTSTGDPSTEQVLLNIRLYNSSHRGGGMTFRGDGYLYVTIGDQFHYDTAQDISDTLEGGSLRLAVDVTDNGNGTWSCPPGTHLPRRTFDTADEISGLWYCIPNDNPWLDPAGNQFEEYCSIGHRNPHRLARDPLTDRLWSGEIGESTREEINVIECGNNYGWPFREGLVAGPFLEPPTIIGVVTDPVIDFTRDEAIAIIGGYVYRGTKFPELFGLYLAGDYATSRVWAITLDETTMSATKAYLASFTAGALGTWGQDNDGEVFLGDVGFTGPLYTLERVGDSVADAPSLLSELGAFSDLADLVPSPFWVPYELNQPFWSDGASKSRFIAVPNDGTRNTPGEQIGFSPNDDWTYPLGTVLMKHFELPLDETDPTNTTRLETRFMVLGDDQDWYGLTYRWRADQTEADLLAADERGDYTIQLSGGGTRAQTWYFPSRLDCLSCHRQNTGGVLGPRTHQLNGDFTYPSTGRTDNQIRTWNDLGMFSPAVDDASIPMLLKSPALADVTAPLDDRARSWLSSNCSSCHRPGGANAGFDTRFTTPFVDQGLAWTGVRNNLGNPDTVVIYPGDPVLSAAWRRTAALGGIAMPPLAKALVEEPAVDLLAAWIERIDADFPRQGLSYEYYELDGLLALPDFDALTPTTSGTVSDFNIAVRERGDDFAIRFRGYLLVEAAGTYTFYTRSDDGSQLFIEGALVVDNDGLHGIQEVSGGIPLEAGHHEIVVTMFDASSDQFLDVSWNGPATGGTKERIPSSLLFQEPPPVVTNAPPVLTSPGDQDSRQGEVVSLDLGATDDDGDFLYFDADGLPAGLTIDHDSGRISGTLGGFGVSTVTASASDGPTVSVVAFEWSVAELEGMPMPDGGVPDGGVPDGGEPDGGPNGSSGGGCSVHLHTTPVDLVLFLGVFVLLWVRRMSCAVQS